MRKNYDLVDLTKIILSFFVVAIHTGFLGEHVYPMVRLAVPMFFILTGFFAFSKIDAQEGFKNQQKTMLKIVVRYLKLYLFWFIVLLPNTLELRNYFEDGIKSGLLKMAHGFLFDSTFRVSWFLMACVLGVLIIFYLSRKLPNILVILLTLPVYLFATFTCGFRGYIATIPEWNAWFLNFEEHFGTPCMNFMIALLYVAIGRALITVEKKEPKKIFYIVGTVISFALLLVEYQYMSGKSFFVYSADCLFLLAPTATFIILWILNSKIKIKGAPIFRKISTIVYCVHLPIYTRINEQFIAHGWVDPYYTYEFLLTCLLTVSLGLVLLQLEKSKYLKFLRFAH